MPLTIVFKHTIFILSLFVPFIVVCLRSPERDVVVHCTMTIKSSNLLKSFLTVSVPFPLVSQPATLCFSVPNGCATALIDFPSSLNRQLSGFLVGSTSSYKCSPAQAEQRREREPRHPVLLIV